MKLRGLLAGLAVVVLLMLAFTYGGFVHNNMEAQITPDPGKETLHILAPYEINVHKKTLEAVAKDYSQMDGHHEVTVEFISPEDYRKEIGKRIDMGKTPDLIICENTMMPALVGMGAFLDISSWATASQRSVYYRNIWGNTMNDGKYYGIPLTLDPYVLFYNQDFLDSMGLQPPETWEDLAGICSACSLGNYGFGFAAKRPEEITSFYMQMLYSLGGTLREVNGEAGLMVLDFLDSRKKRKEIPNEVVNWTQVDLTYGFMKGNMAAMAGRLSMTSLLEAFPPEFTVGVKEMPFGKKHAYLYHGENIGITVSADYEAAIDFLSYLSLPAVGAKLAEGFDTIPVLIEVPYPPKEIAPDPDYLAGSLGNGVSKGSYGSWFDISSSISEELYQLLEGQWSALDEIADSMQDKVRTAIIDQ